MIAPTPDPAAPAHTPAADSRSAKKQFLADAAEHVRDTGHRAFVRKALGGPGEADRAQRAEKRRDPFLAEAEEGIQRALGTKTRIRERPEGGGTIAVSYRSDDDLARIVDIFRTFAP